MNVIPVSFKEVYSTNAFQITVNNRLTVTQFINAIKPIIALQLHIDSDNIEIVEGGQSIPGMLAEEAPALTCSNKLLKTVWGEKLNVAFYVRRRNVDYIEARLHRQMCPVCLEQMVLAQYYSCNHGLCAQCYSQCITHNRHNCPLCRGS